MQFVDAAQIAGTRLRADGTLVADARVARTGIQLYAGHEVGKPEMSVVRVYRPAEEVFSVDARASFAHRPLTNDHPKELVTAANWKALAVGHTVDEVTIDGNRLRVPLLVSDSAAIEDVQGGKQELSAGYTCNLDWTAGTTPEGESFDAVQRDIRANHIAIVQRGRAGSECRIGDADLHTWGAAPLTIDQKDQTMPDNLRTVVVDGLSVQTTDQGAQAIEKLTKDRDDARKALSDAQAEHAKALAAKDADLAKKDAALDAEKAKVLSDADLDKRVAARAALVTVAKAIAKDVKTDGLSDAGIRKAVVTAVLGDAAVAGKAEAYIDARFEILAEDAAKKGSTDPFREAAAGGLRTSDGADKAASDAYAQMVKDMQSAHHPAQAN
ncbi:DUF2213 domain-containing protein [Aquabacter sp. CN5-332]|uniref:DUF2213 domain-containing protein n=1 Tax=Aquabacter sp. CN5-332 TaxID=3156608 RepID=UPI0032B422B9